MFLEIFFPGKKSLAEKKFLRDLILLLRNPWLRKKFLEIFFAGKKPLAEKKFLEIFFAGKKSLAEKKVFRHLFFCWEKCFRDFEIFFLLGRNPCLRKSF